MNKIISKRFFSENVAEIVVEAPLIARSRRAGHFVIIRVDAQSERVPLTISAADIEQGTITLVVQQIGVSTHKLLALNPGDSIHDIVGPLGRATRIEKYGTVVCACGGVGGARIKQINQALNGERIDIFNWDDDPVKLIAQAIAPAVVLSVMTFPDLRQALIIVPDLQYSLAIGKAGQNARLASQVTGWKIDIKDESTAAAEHIKFKYNVM